MSLLKRIESARPGGPGEERLPVPSAPGGGRAPTEGGAPAGGGGAAPSAPSPRLVTQLEALYRVGQLHGLAAAKAWLTEHGIAWRELVKAPRRPGEQRPTRRAPRISRPPGRARASCR